jgi:hypothetical protein
VSTTGNKIRRVILSGALVAGAGLGAAGVASAATGSSTTQTTASSATTAPSAGSSTTPPAGAPDPATMTHGPGETLLTGTQLAQATTAANSAVPGATIIRAETNSSGSSPYEVHMKKADGTMVTVELDSNFAVVTTVTGFGHGPAGGKAPTGQPPTGAAPTGSAPSSSTNA